MSRGVYASEVLAELEFARRAAENFANNPKHMTYTSDDIQPGCLLAIRWGLGEDCVLVTKLDYAHQPTNYMEIVREFKKP